MKKRYLGLGLVGTLILSCTSTYQQPINQPKLAPVNNPVNQPRPSPVQPDEYTKYVYSLKIVPPELYEVPKECNKEPLEAIHQKALTDIANEEYRKMGGHWDHNRWVLLDTAISADAQWANCFSKSGEEKYRQKMLEIAQHYESFHRWDEAARVYYYIGDVKKARELFGKKSFTEEELIFLTPREELPALLDDALKKRDGSLAGKIEWVLGNQERAREIITKWAGYSHMLQLLREYIRDGHYLDAVYYFGRGSKIPFFREVIGTECENIPPCLQELWKYAHSERILMK